MDTDGDGSFDEAEFTRACVKVYTPAVDAAHVEANPEAEDAKEDIIEAKESADRAAAATKAAAARANEEARAKSFAQATRGLGGGGMGGGGGVLGGDAYDQVRRCPWNSGGGAKMAWSRAE